MTLEQARTEARKVLGAVATGIDPLRERKMSRHHAQTITRTIRELCDDYTRDRTQVKGVYVIISTHAIYATAPVVLQQFVLCPLGSVVQCSDRLD